MALAMTITDIDAAADNISMSLARSPLLPEVTAPEATRLISPPLGARSRRARRLCRSG